MYHELRKSIQPVKYMFTNRRMKKSYMEMHATCAFSESDGIEAIAYDNAYQRLAVSSHHGGVKLFAVKPHGTHPSHSELNSLTHFYQAPSSSFGPSKGQLSHSAR